MPQYCDECGSSLPESGTCRDHLDDLLLLEWQIPGGSGELAHFYAVGTYNLQHPRSMNLTADALAVLRTAINDCLEGRATIEEIRQRARRGAAAAGRVTRRPGDPEVSLPVTSWPMTIADVLTVGADRDAYSERVSRWARSAVSALEHSGNAGLVPGERTSSHNNFTGPGLSSIE